MKQIPITDPQMKWYFGHRRHWALTFKNLRCPEHNVGPGFIHGGTYQEPRGGFAWERGGSILVKVILEVCCDNFFNTIIEIEKQHLSAKQNVQRLDEWYEQRAANSENSEIIVVGGIEVRDVDIVDLWSGSKGNGGYLILTGKRKVPIPLDEVRRVKDFYYYGNDSAIQSRRNISGQTIYENEIAEVVYEGETPFVRLTDNRLIEIKPIEVYHIDIIVRHNKRLKEEKLALEEAEVLQKKIEN
jgi:hypothetical protein